MIEQIQVKRQIPRQQPTAREHVDEPLPHEHADEAIFEPRRVAKGLFSEDDRVLLAPRSVAVGSRHCS